MSQAMADRILEGAHKGAFRSRVQRVQRVVVGRLSYIEGALL